MYDLYPYFTNDGSVGLFSQQDDDIYHSTYGALTESWQKFIIPSHLQDFIAKNSTVKILDICYGIGYNTKTALNVFVKNAFKKNKKVKKNNSFTLTRAEDVAAIYTDNGIDEGMAGKNEFCENNYTHCLNNYEAIYTDNNLGQECAEKQLNNSTLSTKNNLDADYCKEIKSTILIDAVDIDKTLIGLSPFIQNITPLFVWLWTKSIPCPNQNKFAQIKKIQSSKINRLKKDFRILNEVQLIIFLKLIEQKFKFDDKILQTILTLKKYSPFISRFMLNFTKFHSNLGYNNDQKKNKSTFLHNIYYRYVSKSYKNVKNLVENNKIDLNFHIDDARCFIKTSAQVYDFIFLDAFTPSKCPSLWTVEFLGELYTRLNDDGMILTYSNAAAVRNAFINAGFNVGKIYDKSIKKFVGTIATKNIDLIEHSLDEHDMGLVNSKAGICYRDTNLDLDNAEIIANRTAEAENSMLISSSQFLKGNKR